MTGTAAPVTAMKEDDERLRRVIGQVGGETGPTLICIAGIHGNEVAGVRALRRVFRTLDRQRPTLHGHVVGLAGNLAALARQRRYIDRDFNRQWTTQRLRSLDSPADDTDEPTEYGEVRELLAKLEQLTTGARGEVVVLDLHTTSSESGPFIVMGDTPKNRAFAMQFPVPIILGLEEHLDGTLSEYLTDRGHVALTLEAGQHDSPAAVDAAEAAIWIALAATGILADDPIRPALAAHQTLVNQAEALPRVLEVRHRHPVAPGDGFRMQPGFKNFDLIEVGQLLAKDRRGTIRSSCAGRMLMPLYQELGSDGFFIVREFRPIWLKISALLRQLRVDAIAHWLPGISRHRDRPDTLVVDRKIAHWRTLEVLHLLGFRKHRALRNVLLVSRRRHDPSRT